VYRAARNISSNAYSKHQRIYEIFERVWRSACRDKINLMLKTGTRRMAKRAALPLNNVRSW